MKKVLLSFLAVIMLSSCEKDKEEFVLTYPSTFVPVTYNNTTPVKMYTVGGEVTDQHVIKSYIERRKNWDTYLKTSEHFEKVENAEEQFIIESSSAGKIITKGYPVDYDLTSVGKLYTFTSKQEQTYYEQHIDAQDKFFSDFHYAVGKHKLHKYDEKVLPPGSGYSLSFKAKLQTYTYLNGNKLEVPMLVYSLRNGTKEAYFENFHVYNNEFDPACLKMLGENDTLVYQQFILSAVKQ